MTRMHRHPSAFAAAPLALAAMAAALVCVCAALAAPAPTEAADLGGPLETTGRVFAVTVHNEWASITRVATFQLGAGTHEVRFTNLPATIESASIRADAGGRALVTRVTYEVREDLAAYKTGLDALTARLVEAQEQATILDEKLQVIAKEEGLLDAIAERTAQQSGDQVGSGKIDLEEITRVSKYLSEQNAALLVRRRGITDDKRSAEAVVEQIRNQKMEYEAAGPPLNRSALLGISIDEASDPAVQIQLTYLASGVRSHVLYSVRTEANLSQSIVEFELEIEQQTSEDWNDVNFAYSTHPVVDPTAPPTLQRSMVEPGNEASSSLSVRQPGEDGPLLSGRASLARLVGQGGKVTSTGSLGSPPFAVFRLPQPISIPSGRAQTQRLRLGTFVTRPQFRYVAVPVISDNAFLRGTVENTSHVHWLPGPVSIFLGSEYVGETTLPYVAPGSSVDLFFGTDHRVTAQRIQVSNRTRSTGLLGDGRETLVEYAIRLGNATGQTIPVEVWDRAPMTRDDRISISTTSYSVSLSRDEYFRLRQRSTGLLRWDVELPASGREATIQYTLDVTHKSDVEVPEIPD